MRLKRGRRSRKMRRRHGRRMSVLRETLSYRVEAMYPIATDEIMSPPTTYEIVNNLRSTYLDYHQIKQQTLTRFVEETLQSIRNHHERPNMCTKKRKIIAQCEASKSPSTSSDLTSESGVAPSKVSFDLTKTMLRNSYIEKNVELEMGKSISIVNEGEVEIKLKLARKQFEGNGNDGSCGDVKVEENDVIRFRNLGGTKKVMEELNMLLSPIIHPKVARKLRVKPTSSVLFRGPPGCGKTTLVRVIANETRLPFYHISATKVVSGVSGESEQNIRDLFSKAQRTAPSIIFIDEIDANASKRENFTREMEKQIVTQLLLCMDQPHSENYVLVIGATNWPDAIDPAFRRHGIFDREIFIDRPDQSSREDIISVLTCIVTLEGSVDLKKLVKSTLAFVVSDLQSVINHSGYMATRRIVRERYSITEPPDIWFNESWLAEEVDKAAIKMSDLEVL